MSNTSYPLAGLAILILAACGGDEATTASPLPLAALKTVVTDTAVIPSKSKLSTIHASCTGEDIAKMTVGSGAFFITTTTVAAKKVTQTITTRWPTIQGFGTVSGLIYGGHQEADFEEVWVAGNTTSPTFTLHAKRVVHTTLWTGAGNRYRLKSVYEVRDGQVVTDTSVEECDRGPRNAAGNPATSGANAGS